MHAFVTLVDAPNGSAAAAGSLPLKASTAGVGGASAYKVLTAATTNAASVKASTGRLYGYSLANTAAAARFVRFYDLAAAPTVGTSVPLYTVAIPAGATVQLFSELGVNLVNGLGIAITAAAADLDATVTAANDVMGAVFYA